MTAKAATLWTLEELAARVAAALADAQAPLSGRVTPVPNERVIRYYTTIGLVDRPAAMRGRVALYGRRHLLQLVAVKRLQTKGLPLAQVQAELAGAGDAALARIAALPAGVEASPGHAVAPELRRARREEAFWLAAPAAQAAAPAAVTVSITQGIRLAEGVVLQLDAARPVSEEDAAALQEAARELLDTLHGRGLLAGKEAP